MITNTINKSIENYGALEENIFTYETIFPKNNFKVDLLTI
jgi:hypothetical protein